MARPSKLSVMLSSVSVILIVLALISAGVPIVPMVWYRLSPGTVGALEKILKKPPTSFGATLQKTGEKEVYQPPIDAGLPAQNRLIIPAIGVDTEIIEQPDEQYEAALRVGVWRTPEFGTAFDRNMPMVLVAHRFGYLKWSNAYRRQNSFFNLPKLKPGDRVGVIWGQRKYTYEIYNGEEAEVVTDYTADLILYTCKYLQSPERIFRYARLVQE